MRASLSAGDRLGRYEIVRPLASGGMAEVFVARSSVGRAVALKRIRAEFARDETFVQLFLREARIAIGLVHPNIAQVLDVGEANGSIFLVMELVEGISVLALQRAAWARGERLPLPVVVWLIERAARALHHAHTRMDEQGVPLSIVHRDVSPHNILLDRSGEVKLIDFGVARAANAAQLTRPGITRGKYLYFSPEQIGMQPLDGRSDIYALGVVFYELLLGSRPYDGELLDVLQAISRGSFVPPHELDPTLPAELAELCLDTLRTKPEARCPDGQTLANALERWAHTKAPEVDDAVIRAALAHYAPAQLAEALGRPLSPAGASTDAPPALAPWRRPGPGAADGPAARAPSSSPPSSPTPQPTTAATHATPIARFERILRSALVPLLILGVAAGGLGLFWLVQPAHTPRFVGRRPARSRHVPEPRPEPPKKTSGTEGVAWPPRPADGAAREHTVIGSKDDRYTFAFADARIDFTNLPRFEVEDERRVALRGEVHLAGDRVTVHELLLLPRATHSALTPRFVGPPGFTLPDGTHTFRLLLLNPSSFALRQLVFPDGHFELSPPGRWTQPAIGARQITDPWAQRLPYLRIDWNQRYRIRVHVEPAEPTRPPLAFAWVGTPIDLLQWSRRKKAGFTADDLSGLIQEQEPLETDGLGAVWLMLAAGPEAYPDLDEAARLIVDVERLGPSRLSRRSSAAPGGAEHE